MMKLFCFCLSLYTFFIRPKNCFQIFRDIVKFNFCLSKGKYNELNTKGDYLKQK